MLQIRNKWSFDGNKRWDWTAFIDDGGSGELDEIKYVEYYLHSSFPKPVRRIKTRSNSFALETNGWGMFWIRAKVFKDSGESKHLEHWLVLERDPPKGVS